MTRPSASINSDDPRSKAWNTKGETAKPVDLFARISRIEQAHTHPRERGRALLQALCEGLGAVAGAITFSLGSEEYDFQTEDGPRGVDAWLPALRSAALESRSHTHTIARVFGSKTEAPEFVVIAVPFDLAGRDPFGAVAVLCRCNHASQAERLQLHLRSASILASSILARSTAKRPAVEMDDFARVLSRAGQYKSVEQFAYAMTNAAKQRFNCEQTALGIVRRGKLKVACISGLDHVKHRSPGVHHIEQAMGECADAREPIVEQTVDRWEGGDVAADGMLHKRWRAACAGASVASVPVMAGDVLVAILSLRRTPDEPFDTDEIAAIQKLLTPLGSAIPLIAGATRSLPAHAVLSTKRSAGWLVRPRSFTKKLLIAGAITGATWYAFMPAMYRVTTPGTVIAEREHVVASTLDGRISEVFVRAGDRVDVGAPLFEMDTARLRTEEAGLLAEIDRADIRIKEAIAKSDPATASVARAERDVHLARLKDVRDRISDATINAPQAGIVTGEGISNLQGRVVPEGEPLLAIADESTLALELRLPQSRITDLTQGAHLRFASHARPENPGESELVRISPTGVERDGRTVFMGKGPLPTDQEWLRPGMEGVAIIDAGMHPNWWISLHRVIDAARLNFWID